MICAIVIFSLGSQIFYLIPFYMLYPVLICKKEDGLKFACDHFRACQKDILSYQFDYSHSHTLVNFMTQLDLVCYQPYYIGLLGTISFVSFAIGSLFFTK